MVFMRMALDLYDKGNGMICGFNDVSEQFFLNSVSIDFCKTTPNVRRQDLCISVFDARSSLLITHKKIIIFYRFLSPHFFLEWRKKVEGEMVSTEKRRFFKCFFLLLIETVSLTYAFNIGSKIWMREANNNSQILN